MKASKDLYRQIFKSAKLSNKDSVLEVGCGKGKGVDLLAKELGPKRATGLDLNSRFVSIAKKRNADKRVSFLNGDACNMRFEKEFSKIICVEASQHFLDIDGFLASANHALSDNGRLTITGFFTDDDANLKYLRSNIHTVKNNIDLVRNIHTVKNKMIANGFTNVEVVSIGGKVIPQYEEWLKQVSYENMWSKAWKEAFEKGKVDYYIITADKAHTEKLYANSTR